MDLQSQALGCFRSVGDSEDHEYFMAPWLEQVFLIGNHLAESPNSEASIKHTVITVPTTELVTSFLIAGLVSNKLERILNADITNEISLQDLRIGMHIQANSGQVTQKFSGIIEAINLDHSHGGRITLKIKDKSKTLLADTLRSIRPIDYEGNSLNDVGYWDPFNRRIGFESPWTFMGHADAEQLSRLVEPICCINAPREKLNEEMEVNLNLSKGDFTLQVPLKELIAPVGDGRKAPFFAEINPTKNSITDAETSYVFNYQLLLGSRAIIENFDTPKSSNVISIIGRSELASGSVASMILERYFSGTSVEKSYSPFLNYPSIELLTFGVTN